MPKTVNRVGDKKILNEMEQLSFSNVEMAAIIKTALAMAAADGKVDDTEKAMIAIEAMRFNLASEKFESLLKLANDMSATDSMAMIAGMKAPEKRYVAAYLGTMIAADGDIDDKEMALWRLISTLCDLPTMNIADAIQYMAN